MGTRFARLWRSINHYLLQFRQRSQLDRLLGTLSAPENAALTLPAEDALASVIIPALNEEKAIASVIKYALSDPATGEVIVVDDSSIDGTAEIARAAGAVVITSSMLGKGISMRDGVAVARYEFVVFLDGDLSGLQPNIVSDMVGPLRKNQADFVKAKFGRGGGRVTELTAKPMLKVFFPELAHFSQPLGGIISGRVSLFKNLSFEAGYGVDIGLLIGAFRKGARLAEVDIGSLEHESQPLTDLTSMAFEVSRVIHQYSREAGRLHVEQINEMYENQRQAVATFEYVLTRQKDRTKLLLLDMDETITEERYIEALATATGTESELESILQDASLSDIERCERITELFKFVHRSQFEKVASGLTLKPGVIEFVNQMRRERFMVGVISNHYFAGTEIIRKRIFADFALAHVLQFQNDICTGKLQFNEAFRKEFDRSDLSVCKSHVLDQFRAKTNAPLFKEIWAIGDAQDDIKMLSLANRAFVIDPKSDEFERYPHIQRVSSFAELRIAVTSV
jgi:glucosyl-3-phosphoglycerate synthase